MTASARHCFDRIAAKTRWHFFTPEEERLVRDFARRWKIRPGERVLEPGCGAGRLTEKLAEWVGPAGRVLAFDESPEFLRVARRRGLPTQAKFRRALVQTIRLRPASYDHVVCFNVFPHLRPPARVLRRLVAVLRPGGRLWIAHTASRERINAIHLSGPKSIHSHLIPPPRELARLLVEAGLENVRVEARRDRFSAWGQKPISRKESAS